MEQKKQLIALEAKGNTGKPGKVPTAEEVPESDQESDGEDEDGSDDGEPTEN